MSSSLGWSGLEVADASGEGGEELLGQRRDLVEDGGEARLVEHVQAAVAHRPHGRRSRATIEQGELTEVVTRAELGGDLVAVFDGRLAGSDDVELVAGLALRADDLAGRHLHGVHHHRDAIDLRRQQAGEQRYRPDELLQLGSRRHGPKLLRRPGNTRRMTHLQRLEDDGFVVLERAVGDDVLAQVRAELAPYLGESALHGRNDFEGYSTNRVYALLAKAPSIARLVEHDDVVALLDELLLPNYLLSANLAINLLPGETAQSLHSDDGFYRLPRPRPAISVSTIWAIDDFTIENGATQVIPGSHRWGSEVPAEDDQRIVDVVMPAGSVVVFLGTLWHRGGANRSRASRLAISPQYCEPWARQQEQMVLSVGAAAVQYSDRVRTMLGYGIHPPFMGHVNGMHPLRVLDPDYDPSSTNAERTAAAILERQGGPFV